MEKSSVQEFIHTIQDSLSKANSSDIIASKSSQFGIGKLLLENLDSISASMTIESEEERSCIAPSY